jgi:hypothetical protein
MFGALHTEQDPYRSGSKAETMIESVRCFPVETR